MIIKKHNPRTGKLDERIKPESGQGRPSGWGSPVGNRSQKEYQKFDRRERVWAERRQRQNNRKQWEEGGIPTIKPKVRLENLSSVKVRDMQAYEDPGGLAYCRYRSPHDNETYYLLVRVLDVNKITAKARFFSDKRYKQPIFPNEFIRTVDINSLLALEMS